MANVEALITMLRDTALSIEEREASLRALQGHARAHYEVWQALCGILHDARQPLRLRVDAARAVAAANPAAAPNQLARFFTGDPTRGLRVEAVAVLGALGRVPSIAEPRLLRDLAALNGDRRLVTLLNLAATYGRDPRALAALFGALTDPDPQIRAVAVRGLGILGEMSSVVNAMTDPSPTVRAAAAEVLGYYGLRAEPDLAALEAARSDPDATVSDAATVALKRLGALPVARPRVRSTPPVPASPSGPPTAHDWRPLLEAWSAQWLHIDDYALTLPDDVVQSGWLGFPPATEDAIRAAELRLGRVVPPSYRAFLLVSDGWRCTSTFIDRLFSANEIDRFETLQPDWVAAWTQEPSGVSESDHRRYDDPADNAAFRTEYLHHCIQISDVGDSAVYLLNPAMTDADGEWEAWLIANWIPGARRHPSFWALMQAEYASFLQLEHPDE